MHVSGYTLPTIYRIWRGLGVRQSISRDFRLNLCLFRATFHGFYLLYCSSNVWSVIRHIVFFPKVRALSGISFFLRSLLLKLAFSWQLLSKCPRYSTVLTTVRWSLPGILTGKKKISMEYLRRFQISPLKNVKKNAYVGLFAGPKMETAWVFHGNFIFSDFPDALWVTFNRKVCGKVVASLYKATFLNQFFRFLSFFVKSPPSGIGKFSETAPLKAKSFCKVISVVSTNK